MANRTHLPSVENFIVLWLDEHRDFAASHNQEHVRELRSIVNTVHTFNDLNGCFDKLTRIEDEKVFLIVSDSLLHHIAAREVQFTGLVSIYVLSDKKTTHRKEIPAFKKGKGIFTRVHHLCSELTKEVRQREENLVRPITISASSSVNELPPSFMYCQLLKENFFTLNDHPTDRRNLIDCCRPGYGDIVCERTAADSFQNTYDRTSTDESPIWWYTKPCFLYRMLNKALRTLDVPMLMKMSFYIRDLHKQLQQRHTEPKEAPPSAVYRGQRLSHADLEQLKKDTGKLQFFNNFLSTSKKKEKALHFIHYDPSPDTAGVLWEIQLNPNIPSVPFSYIEDITAVRDEHEVLFSIGAVFRIDEVTRIDDYWRVTLTVTGDGDPTLTRLTDHIRRSLGSGVGWRPIGQLMIRMGHFEKAKEIFESLLTDVTEHDRAEQLFLHNQLGHVEKQLGRANEALGHYREAINCADNPHDARLSSTYSNIGVICKAQKQTEQALEYFQRALQIDKSTADPNRLEIAVDYNNIGAVLDDGGRFAEALEYYEKALELKLVHLSPHDPSLANNYSNIGLVHRKMGDCATAVSFYEKALAIQKRSLQENHPAFIATYGNMAIALETLGDVDEALSHAEKAANIAKRAYGEAHPEARRRADFLRELQRRR